MALVLSEESGIFSAGATDTSSDPVSSSSTPPTTVADTASQKSESPKHDVITVAPDAINAPSLIISPEEEADAHRANDALSASARRRRSRSNANNPVYNLAKLSGTAGHGKRRSKGDIVINRTRNYSTKASQSRASRTRSGRLSLDASLPQRSLRGLDSPRTRQNRSESARATRLSSRASGASPVTSFASKLSALNKRNRKNGAKSAPKMSRELMRLQDTKEFAHVDDKPVHYTVWANGKYVDPNAPPEPEPADDEADDEENDDEENEEEPEPVIRSRKRRVKKHLDKGLYAGQEAPLDIAKGLTPSEKKKLAQLPELIPSGRLNKTMPLPMFNGLRTLIAGRDFKLPYHVCNPLPPGQPKPDEWKKMTKNRFIGNSKDYWRKSPHFHDYQSKCVCQPEDGCGESCQNRIMLYECDEHNCNVGRAHCSNRAFADLTARRNRGGKYRVGVEVIKTSDRGYGVRSNRCFRPNQIIMEYAGEIITEEECERRMNEVYKNNECYYLMSFDQNMIIDATTGSIARFVNHSCNPNCRMIKWIVSGQPRMALFAGDKPIMTGDELTYDYNFDPFSAKNVQKCLCGEPNCRGVLGPKSREREAKNAKVDLKNAVKATVKAGKRKLKELIGDGEAATSGSKAKKRKIQPATGVKRTLSKAGAKVATGAAAALKKGMSTITATAKKAALGSKSPAQRRASAGAILSKPATKRVIKTYGRAPAAPRQRVKTPAKTTTTISVTTASTIVALGAEEPSPPKKDAPAASTPTTSSNKTATETAPTPIKTSSGRTVRVRTLSEPLPSPRKAVELPRASEEITLAVTE